MNLICEKQSDMTLSTSVLSLFDRSWKMRALKPHPWHTSVPLSRPGSSTQTFCDITFIYIFVSFFKNILFIVDICFICLNFWFQMERHMMHMCPWLRHQMQRILFIGHCDPSWRIQDLNFICRPEMPLLVKVWWTNIWKIIFKKFNETKMKNILYSVALEKKKV